jgi:hypothetical protein
MAYGKIDWLLLTHDGQRALDDKQVTPRVQFGFNVEHTKCQKAGKSVGDVGRSIEQRQATCEFASSIESCQIVNDQGKEGGLGHAYALLVLQSLQLHFHSARLIVSSCLCGIKHTQEPPQSHHPTPILHARSQQCRASKAEHKDRQHAMRPILLSQHTNRWRKDDIRYVEDTQHDIVLVSFETKVGVHVIRLSVAEITFVKCIEKIHKRKHR